MKAGAFWQRWSDPARRPRYRLTRSLFLRGLGVVYFSAFGSLALQVDGLIGSNGILPAADYLDRAGRVLGPGFATYWRLPTVFWLDTSDRALYTACGVGLLLSAGLIAGILPSVCTALLWLLYLSFVVVGQDFLGYQWDALLLETGLLAVLLAPWRVQLSQATDQPWWFAIWLLRWLAFRLMFLSGVVKLASHDPTWQDWTALEYHYQTQPLPAWTSWNIHQMPLGFHWLSVGFMFYAELVAPFFVFGPRPVRLAGFASLVLLQLLIAATGNYGFFNLLAIVICLCILDDRDWEWLSRALQALTRSGRATFASRAGSGQDVPDSVAKRWSWPRRLAVGIAGGTILAVTATQTIEVVAPAFPIPSELETLGQWSAPLRSTNHYGLFAVMATTRPEIIIEGSDDGVSWKPYRFRWKPCELDRRPQFAAPHLPRLDWQMWFAALAGDCRSTPWFVRFERRLLEGSPAVLGLLRENPFPAHPPRYVRARLFLYEFTRRGSPDWWSRTEQGLFCPPLSLENLE
jgi:lipase maturation factor 1